MMQTIKTFGQKILYGFGFGTGMTIVYTNAELFKIPKDKLKNIINK